MAVKPLDVLPIVIMRLRPPFNIPDDLMISYIEEIGQRILHYCHLTDVPDGLKFVWASMAIDALKIEQAGDEAIHEATGGALNVKVGDTQTSPANNSAGLTDTSKSVIDALVLNYAIDLNRYRKLRW